MKKEEITLKNTKTEILDALNAALEREKNIAKAKYEPEKEEKAQKIEKAVEVSRQNVEQKIFSDDLNNKFKDLELAITAEEEKLKNLYGIEKELCNLVTVINAGKDYMIELEETKKLRADELNENIKNLEETYNLKMAELEKEYDAKAQALKTERSREIEEYNYKLKREREISNNKWEDEKQERESALAQKEIETLKLLDEAKANAKHLEDLEEKVNSIPSLLEKEYARGRKDATLELEKEHKFATEILSKDFQNTIDRQADKIDSLQQELTRSNSDKDGLLLKLDQAYLQIKEMATKTVEATGGVKILGNSTQEANK